MNCVTYKNKLYLLTYLLNQMEIPVNLIVYETETDIQFVPEDDDGYIEYKLRLDTKGKFGLEKLYSQMNWRLEEGHSLLGQKEAHYLLGVKDNGKLGGLNDEELYATFEIFKLTVNKCNADISNFLVRTYIAGSMIYAVIVKKEKRKIKEFNVAFVGPSQHGKTTTIGNLVYSRGDEYARNLIFKHEHEKITGITSSVKKEIVGIKYNNIVNYASSIKGEWGDIVNMSDSVINLIDLPGDMRYLKTTLFGLEVYDLDLILIVIDKSKENINQILVDLFVNYAIALNIQYKIMYISDDLNDPTLFTISNKIKNGLNKLENLLCNLDNITNVDNNDQERPMLFSVIDRYSIQDSGIIFSGIVKYGILEVGKTVLITNGKDYVETKVKSIHKKQIDSQLLYPKETGAIVLDISSNIPIDVNKYIIITDMMHQLLTEIKFKIIWSPLCDVSLIAQRGLLFVDNNVISVIPEICDCNTQTLLLKFETPNIIPILSFKTDVVCFFKNAHAILIGKL